MDDIQNTYTNKFDKLRHQQTTVRIPDIWHIRRLSQFNIYMDFTNSTRGTLRNHKLNYCLDRDITASC